MLKYKINIEQIISVSKIKKQLIKTIAQKILLAERINHAEITIVIVDDNYIRRLNRDFLNKDVTTDVLSFDLSDDQNNQILEGEIYVNIEQIRRQAIDFRVSFEDELYRVVIHGLLHLVGYEDQIVQQQQIMTEKEDHFLAVLRGEEK